MRDNVELDGELDDREQREISQLYVRHVPDACRLAYLLTGDLSSAQDVAHDAFLRCASRRHALREADRFDTYLRRAVVNEVASRHRSATREQRRAFRSVREDSRVAGSCATRVEQRVDLFKAIRLLPVRQRAVVVLKYWADMTDHQAAETLNWPVGTVKSSLSRALQNLKQVVTDDERLL